MHYFTFFGVVSCPCWLAGCCVVVINSNYSDSCVATVLHELAILSNQPTMASNTPALGAKEAYLILYNSLCCIGWANVWFLAILMVGTGVAVDRLPLSEALANVYATTKIATLLIISQTAAVLEIVHAVVGLVRSPVLVTAMQVGSRLVALLALVYSAQAQCTLAASRQLVALSAALC